MPKQPPPHISSVSWSKNMAKVGEVVTLTANLVSVKDGATISFIISEYSGTPPQAGGGGVDTPITTLTAPAGGGVAEVTWTVPLVAESKITRGLPEYRFRAKLGAGAGVVSKLLKLGEVTEVVWVDPLKGAPRSTSGKDTQAYFKGTQKIKLRVKVNGLDGFKVDFYISVRDAMGGVTTWQPVSPSPIKDIPIASGEAVTEWNVDSAKLQTLALGTYRFEIHLKHSGTSVVPNKFRSGLGRHYQGIIGIYGFGPTGPGWSNSEILAIAQAVGGIAITQRSTPAMERIAKQVAPEEKGLELFGYSLGGVAVARLARSLEKRGIPVKVLIGIDPVEPFRSTVVVPNNVKTAISYYQIFGSNFLPGVFGKGRPYVRPGGSTIGISNLKDTTTPDPATGLDVLHENMPFIHHNDVVGAL